MAKKKLGFVDDLAQDAKIYHKLVLKECAQAVRDKIVKEYQSVIEYFYADYIPKEYDRIHGLRDSFVPYYRDNGKGTYSGGIVITSEQMSNIHYHDHRDYVLDMTVVLGFHGTSDVWTTSPSPYKYIVQFRDAIDIDAIYNDAVKTVDKKYRTFIRKQRGW